MPRIEWMEDGTLSTWEDTELDLDPVTIEELPPKVKDAVAEALEDWLN